MAHSSDAVGTFSRINDVMVCPYVESHVVGASRFQQHLNKCRKQCSAEKAKSIVICPYNMSHHIPSADLSLHLTLCRDYLSHKYQQLRGGYPPAARPNVAPGSPCKAETPNWNTRSVGGSSESAAGSSSVSMSSSLNASGSTSTTAEVDDELDNWL